MSDHNTIPPETDSEIRVRLQAFARQVKERTDTEAALQGMPRRSRPPTIRLLVIAAGVLAVVALAAALAIDPEPVDTVDQPPTTECPTTTRRTITSGGQMKRTFAAPVASAATAILLIGSCSDSDDGPTTLAKGVDVEFVGGPEGFQGQTLSIDVKEEDGEVTGEFSVSDIVFVRVDCVDTDIDAEVRFAGTVTKGDPGHVGDVGDLLLLVIREGDPVRVTIGANDANAETCAELLESLPADIAAGEFVDVEAGSELETG